MSVSATFSSLFVFSGKYFRFQCISASRRWRLRSSLRSRAGFSPERKRINIVTNNGKLAPDWTGRSWGTWDPCWEHYGWRPAAGGGWWESDIFNVKKSHLSHHIKKDSYGMSTTNGVTQPKKLDLELHKTLFPDLLRYCAKPWGSRASMRAMPWRSSASIDWWISPASWVAGVTGITQTLVFL